MNGRRTTWLAIASAALTGACASLPTELRSGLTGDLDTAAPVALHCRAMPATEKWSLPDGFHNDLCAALAPRLSEYLETSVEIVSRPGPRQRRVVVATRAESASRAAASVEWVLGNDQRARGQSGGLIVETVDASRLRGAAPTLAAAVLLALRGQYVVRVLEKGSTPEQQNAY